MSSMADAPVWLVQAEHLPDRRLRFWLVEDPGRREVCTLNGVSACYPVVHRAVQDLLQLPDDYFIVNLRIPRPPYVRDGDTVVVTGHGEPYRAVIRGWADSAVLVDVLEPDTGGGGLVAPELLIYDHDKPGPGGAPV